jgi:hypothetical protein
MGTVTEKEERSRFKALKKVCEAKPGEKQEAERMVKLLKACERRTG